MNAIEKMKIDKDYVIEIVKDAAKLFENRRAAEEITVKGVADFVTSVDLSVQNFIQQKLQEKYPEIQFLGEEMTAAEMNLDQPTWVLDPVDGTTNLIYDYHVSVISLALVDKSQPIMGIVYNPYLKELYYAEEGKGSFRNGEPIHVREAKGMEDALIAIGTSPYYKEYAASNFELFHKVYAACKDIRRSGSAAYDLACVACGRLDGYFERSLKIWDFAAGVVLVREAGGNVYDFSGTEMSMSLIGDLVAGGELVADKLVNEYL